MKTTPFINYHRELGGKLVEFAGYELPIEYTGIREEHLAVREQLGVFDVSHMGEFWVTGPQAEAFIQKLTSNNVADLSPGKVQYSCFTNENGGIVDDLLVYCIEVEKYLLVVNAANIEKDWNWCVKYAQEMGLKVGEELQNVSENICQLAVQGPLALKAMSQLVDFDLEEMVYYHCKQTTVAGIPNAVISTTGYTGSGGCEIYVENAYGAQLWEAVMKAGAEFGIKPCGLAARDTLRLEVGFCLYGNDLDDQHTPIEAGLAWITKLVEGNDFVARDIIEKQKEEKPSLRLKGFVLKERGIPRKGYPILNEAGEEIGVVTSGTMSPSTGEAIGLGYVKAAYCKKGTPLLIQIRKNQVKAEIVALPFYQKK